MCQAFYCAFLCLCFLSLLALNNEQWPHLRGMPAHCSNRANSRVKGVRTMTKKINKPNFVAFIQWAQFGVKEQLKFGTMEKVRLASTERFASCSFLLASSSPTFSVDIKFFPKENSDVWPVIQMSGTGLRFYRSFLKISCWCVLRGYRAVSPFGQRLLRDSSFFLTSMWKAGEFSAKSTSAFLVRVIPFKDQLLIGQRWRTQINVGACVHQEE